MSLSQTSVGKLYTSVIDDVIGGVREYFQDEGVDEQVLMELKNTWEAKLQASKAVEPKADEVIPAPLKPPVTQKPVSSMNHGSTGGIPMDYGNKNVSIQITLPAQQGVPDAQPRAITIQVPASALQGNQLQQVLTGPVITATMAMPPNLAPTLLQQHVTAALQGQAASAGLIHQQMQHTAANNAPNNNSAIQNNTTFQSQQNNGMTQLDGLNDSSDDDDDEEEEEEEEADDDDDDLDDDKEEEENEDNDGGAEEEPLNSSDDVSEEDPSDMFDTDNVVVCQYDKITRTRNKWKFYLKDGIMNLGGKDYVFQKSNGDAEW